MKGFTLLEVLIAMAIMAGVVVTVLTGFNHHLGIVNRDREETVMVLLARGLLDDPTFRNRQENKGTFAPQWPQVTWEKTTSPSEVVSGVHLLTLTVNWGAERRVSFVQYLAP
ncbi:MAG TPA: prepilin-type N-terminal cleavage/methylation domain-containing protein [Geobacteraceae bacterium]